MIALFGWGDTLWLIFDSRLFPAVLETMCRDWTAPDFDEALTLGLLDLLASLALQGSMQEHAHAIRRNALLLDFARPLAELVQACTPELMRSRPFIQYILARSVLDMGSVQARPDLDSLEIFDGLLLNQGSGLQLPIFVCLDSSKKPDWDMFRHQLAPNPAQSLVAEVVFQAACFTGDYELQATSLKFIALQSKEPQKYMDALAALQLDLQHDMEGYLGTCLAKFLISKTEQDEAALVSSLLKLDRATGNSANFDGANASLLWARDMVERSLCTQISDMGADKHGKETWIQHLEAYSSRLPRYVTQFIHDHFQISIPEPPEPPQPPTPEPQGHVYGQSTKQGGGSTPIVWAENRVPSPTPKVRQSSRPPAAQRGREIDSKARRINQAHHGRTHPSRTATREHKLPVYNGHHLPGTGPPFISGYNPQAPRPSYHDFGSWGPALGFDDYGPPGSLPAPYGPMPPAAPSSPSPTASYHSGDDDDDDETDVGHQGANPFLYRSIPRFPQPPRPPQPRMQRRPVSSPAPPAPPPPRQDPTDPPSSASRPQTAAAAPLASARWEDEFYGQDKGRDGSTEAPHGESERGSGRWSDVGQPGEAHGDAIGDEDERRRRGPRLSLRASEPAVTARARSRPGRVVWVESDVDMDEARDGKEGGGSERGRDGRVTEVIGGGGGGTAANRGKEGEGDGVAQIGVVKFGGIK